MGTENTDRRRSERLNERWVSIATGYSPRHWGNKDKPANKVYESLGTITEADEPIITSIISDISIERSLTDDPILDMAEARVEYVETEVANIKTDMGVMNEKLDQILQSFANMKTQSNQQNAAPPQTQPQNGASTPQPQTQAGAGVSNNGNTNDTRPKQHHVHHMVGRQMSADEFIEREMQRDRFEFAHNGRYVYTSDINPARVIAKPYMYLYREGISSIKQKLDARQTMSLNEYVDALLSLLADHRAYHKDDYNDIVHHLTKVVRDALERPWHAVRRWTNFVWDSIESGAFAWADRDVIQDERVRLCMTGMYSNSANNTVQSKPQAASVNVICRAFNTRMGCHQRESHGDGHVWQNHACSYCDSVGKTCFHSVRECERRLAHTRNDYPQNRNRQTNYPSNNYNQHQYNQQYQGAQQYPKNG